MHTQSSLVVVQTQESKFQFLPCRSSENRIQTLLAALIDSEQKVKKKKQ